MVTHLPLIGAQPPIFQPMSIVAKRSPISDAAEHLLLLLPLVLALSLKEMSDDSVVFVSYILWVIMVALCNRADHYIFAL